MRGHAQAYGVWLCHPDTGKDCYRLVTVYDHPRPCSCEGALVPIGRHVDVMGMLDDPPPVDRLLRETR